MFRSVSSVTRSAVLVACVAAGVLVSAREPNPRRVIVLGFDGVDPRLVTEYMESGDLPNLKALADQGSFLPLATTNPAESPVSWASFTVGANPGHTGIFDFLTRIPDTYIPDIALVKRGQWHFTATKRVLWSVAFGLLGAALVALLLFPFRNKLRRAIRIGISAAALVVAAGGLFAVLGYVPASVPIAMKARQGTPFWEAAGDADLSCSILQVPVTFPAEGFDHGRLLTGLGTPDIRGTWGTFTVYASCFPTEWSDPLNRIDESVYSIGFADSVTGGKLVQLILPPGDDVEIETFLYGPRNFTISAQDR